MLEFVQKLIYFNHSFSKRSHMDTSSSSQQLKPPCTPDLTNFRSIALGCVNGDYGLQRELPTTGFDITQSWWIPKWLIASSLAISKQSTSFTHCEHRNSDRHSPPCRLKQSIPSQHDLCVQKCIINSVQDKPVSPLCSYWRHTQVGFKSLHFNLQNGYKLLFPI